MVLVGDDPSIFVLAEADREAEPAFRIAAELVVCAAAQERPKQLPLRPNTRWTSNDHCGACSSLSA